MPSRFYGNAEGQRLKAKDLRGRRNLKTDQRFSENLRVRCTTHHDWECPQRWLQLPFLVLEEFHLPQALLRLCPRFVRPAKVLFPVLREHFVSAFHFLDHLVFLPDSSLSPLRTVRQSIETRNGTVGLRKFG
jgi:hypothetical protein